MEDRGGKALATDHRGTNDLVFLKQGSAEITSDQEIALITHEHTFHTSIYTRTKQSSGI